METQIKEEKKKWMHEWHHWRLEELQKMISVLGPGIKMNSDACITVWFYVIGDLFIYLF